MKKIIIYTLIMCGFAFTACDVESTEGVSTVTNFAVVEALGDAIVLVEVGNTFVEPGVSATISGADVPFETLGTLDTNTPGIYDLTYQVINEDGFAAQAFRTVFVYENNGTLAGVWDGKRIGRSGGPILVSSTSDPSVFNCSDLTAGHYEFDRALGRAYASPGQLAVTGSSIADTSADNAFGTWNLTSGAISGDEKTMTWTITIPAFSFGYDCELIKTTP
ncbi:immunoglobulin-like domain-containing protein [Flavivirga jejuensis]|uniref:DUF5011 domain-containing protein n=1 Tax=Flavivirga jejuensis TaxID=870487 RepID=A0ABT8WJK4_9FLAO|nr:immunoglobulin-like domain-containing protein [Flavivirga jejuensis]MDO5973293.1 DUF5011 domain-containing protein [Flavivirga jejuensis]